MKSNTQSDNLIWRLLRRNISPAQLAGYALSNFVGLAIILTALQFYIEVSSVFEDDDSFMSRDYISVSPKVTGLGSLSGPGPETLDSTAIADIARQDWARRVGRYTSARYNVTASLDMGGRGMSTALFFESVPDEFFDITPPGWTFDPESPEIPIVLSKDYLTLYNFGFASSRGLPQLSEEIMGVIPLKISISGRGHQIWLPAHIVGFSSRLNTIAVPDEFMQWANDNFGEGDSATSRVIVELSKPGDPAIKEYLASHGMEMAGDKADSSSAAYFLSILTVVVVGIGLVISLLAFFILMLSIYLLLQKNKDKLHDLMLLGYSPSEVSRQYCRMVAMINGAVCIGAIIVMLISRAIIHGPLSRIGVEASGPYITVGIGVAAMIAVTLLNFASIRRRVTSYFN